MDRRDDGDKLILRREKKVGLDVYGTAFMYPPTPWAIESYEITLRFRPRMSKETYERLQKENEETWKKVDAMRDKLREAGIRHKFDDWHPDTPEQKKLVEEYRVARKALPYHRLPDLYTETHSIDMWDSVQFPLSFADDEEAKACAQEIAPVLGLFKSHRPDKGGK
jgi:hypothetical protein